MEISVLWNPYLWGDRQCPPVTVELGLYLFVVFLSWTSVELELGYIRLSCLIVDFHQKGTKGVGVALLVVSLLRIP